MHNPNNYSNGKNDRIFAMTRVAIRFAPKAVPKEGIDTFRAWTALMSGASRCLPKSVVDNTIVHARRLRCPSEMHANTHTWQRQACRQLVMAHRTRCAILLRPARKKRWKSERILTTRINGCKQRRDNRSIPKSRSAGRDFSSDGTVDTLTITPEALLVSSTLELVVLISYLLKLWVKHTFAILCNVILV